jgi:predicted transcriptional regulator
MRVNARFDDDLARRMAYLTRATNQGVSDVIKSSVLMYYESLRRQEAPKLTHLDAWIGKCDSGRSDLSVNYKALWAEGLAAKHGIKPLPAAEIQRGAF